MDARTRRLVFLAVVTAFALLGTGADCGRRRADFPADPMPPVGPDSTWAGAPTSYRVTTTIGRGRIRYVMDWDGAMDTTDASYASGETAAVVHVWNSPGEASVKVQAINDAYPEKASEWSMVKLVKVIANDAPILDQFGSYPIGVRGIEGGFTVIGHDPGGDSIRFRVDWGDGTDTATAYDSSPCEVVLGHTYASTDTFTLVAFVQDIHGAVSEPESLSFVVGTAGGVAWLWMYEGSEELTSSPVVADVSGSAVGFVIQDGRLLRFDDGREVPGSPSYLTGHPAFCEQTGHVIASDFDQGLWALAADGGPSWSWVLPETLWAPEWISTAVRGDRLYVPFYRDSITVVADEGSAGVRMAAFRPPVRIIAAPVIDAQGDVVFAADSGYLYKMDPDFSAPIWRARLQGNGRIYGPIIGGDGTIYCTTESLYLFAIDPATGTPRWKIILDGEAPRPALGSSALFVGTSSGKVYSVDPAAGVVNWQKQLDPDAFETTPIVVTGGYVYIQNTNDVLYCINQSDGTVVWSCDCKKFLPRGGGRGGGNPRRLQLTDYAPNPSILSNGNIIVVGADAVYFVAGYPERPLDPTAPWPKWQHDLHNTGYVGGGR